MTLESGHETCRLAMTRVDVLSRYVIASNRDGREVGLRNRKVDYHACPRSFKALPVKTAPLEASRRGGARGARRWLAEAKPKVNPSLETVLHR